MSDNRVTNLGTSTHWCQMSALFSTQFENLPVFPLGAPAMQAGGGGFWELDMADHAARNLGYAAAQNALAPRRADARPRASQPRLRTGRVAGRRCPGAGFTAGKPIHRVLHQLRAGAQIEFALDALTVGFNRLDAQVQGPGGFPGAHALADHVQNLQFTIAQAIDGIGRNI